MIEEDKGADSKRAVASVNDGCAGSIVRVADKARSDQHAAESNDEQNDEDLSLAHQE